MTPHRGSKSSPGSRPASELLAEIVEKADAEPHQRINGVRGGEEFVLLTREHYDAFREALYMVLAAVTDLDSEAKMIPVGEMRRRAIAIDIRAARKAKGWTQATLSKKAGLPQSQISRIERDPTATTVRTLKRIARALGLPVASIVG